MCEAERRARSHGYRAPRLNRCSVLALTCSAQHLRQVLVSHTAHPGGQGGHAARRLGAAAHGRPLLVPGRGSCTAAVCALREAFHVVGGAPCTPWVLRVLWERTSCGLNSFAGTIVSVVLVGGGTTEQSTHTNQTSAAWTSGPALFQVWPHSLLQGSELTHGYRGTRGPKWLLVF